MEHQIKGARNILTFHFHIERVVHELGLAFVLAGGNTLEHAGFVAYAGAEVGVFEANGVAVAFDFFAALGGVAGFGDVGVRDRHHRRADLGFAHVGEGDGDAAAVFVDNGEFVDSDRKSVV